MGHLIPKRVTHKPNKTDKKDIPKIRYAARKAINAFIKLTTLLEFPREVH